MVWQAGERPAVGLALSDAVPAVLARWPDLVDYVEVPFEQLVHTPGVIGALELPVVLHCASLSLAGNLPPSPAVVAQLRRWIAETRTPWLGEHLAFVSMSGGEGPSMHTAFAPSVDADGAGESREGPFNVGYTVSPQYSLEILERVVGALDHWQRELGCSLLIENGPVYFEIPGSTWSQTEFINRVCREREGTRLLLDLAHLVCTAANTGDDAGRLLESLPLERVVEVHLSGAETDGGIVWDDHARPIDPIVFELLDRLLHRVAPRAVTIEYNWDPDFPIDRIGADLSRLKRSLSRCSITS